MNLKAMKNMKKWIVLSATLGLLAGLLFAAPARAQVAGATLTGTITDAQGGAVADAKVSAKNLATGVAVDTQTNGTGAYTIPNLNPSDYEVSVTATGFSTTVSKVTLTVGAKQEMNLALTVGSVQQEVQVTGAAPQVELASSTVSGNVQSTEVRELPLNGRDWASLATLQPGVVQARTHLDVTHVGGGGGRGFGDQLSVGGGRPTQNSYRLDGAIVNDYSNAGPGSVLGANLGVDAIQEFTVLTSNYSAEYGFTSGGVINAITKSGTNTFHGSAFDFVRNDAFDARNFFTKTPALLPKNQLIQNQFGASGGWRVFKDKTFLFGDYEGVRKVAGLPVTNGVTISDAVRAGTVTNDTTGGVVTVPVIDPNTKKFLALYPHPAPGSAGCVALTTGTFKPGACDPNIGLAPFVGSQRASENFYTFRADQKISSKDSVFATYLRDSSVFSSPLTFNNELQQFTSYRQGIVAEETHVFSSSVVNSVRVAEDRTNNLGGNSPSAVNAAAGDASLGMAPGFFSPGVTLTSSGVTALPGGVGGGASIQDFWGQIFQVYDDAFVTKGNHGLKFGFSFLAIQVNGYTPLAGFNGSGTFSFAGTFPVLGGNQRTPTKQEQGLGAASCYSGTGSTTDGNSYDASCGSLVNFLTNQPLTATRPFDASSVNKHYLRDKVFGGYIQDDWRIRQNLTLNLGLRYEMSTIPTETHGEIAVIPTPYTSLPCVSTPGCTTTDPTTALRNSFWTQNPTTKNFEPRIGFAWDPFHNGKTAVRGGFGIFDALPLPYELILNNTSSAPWRSTLASPGPGQAVLVSPPAGTWPYGVVAEVGNLHVNDPLTRSFMYVDNNIKRNYVYQYNFNIQRQITPSTTILVGYSGSRGLHNPFQADSVNTAFPCGVNPCAAGQGPSFVPGVGYVYAIPWTGSLATTQLKDNRDLNTTTGSMYNTMWQSRSWYNALQVNVQKRMSHGFQVQGAFTYSKSLDDSSGSTAGDTFQLDAVSETWWNLGLNKGLSDFDVRRNLFINALWNVPTPKFGGAFGEKALGGWQVGVIANLADGVPVYPQLSTDILGENIKTVNSGNLVAGCSAQNLVNSGYRNFAGGNSPSTSFINTGCISLVPATTANAAFCDSAPGSTLGTGTGKAITAKNFCPNIRGDLGRNTIVGPGLFNIDFSLFKNNYIRRISETFNLQFRAEFFNVLNHTNFAPPSQLSPFLKNGNPDPTFGQLTATQGQNRQIQLALKLVW
jgi:hypothetical protein